MFHDIGETLEEDLPRAEMIALPITLILLVVIFGSVVAATLPLAVGVLSIIGTFLVLQVMSGVTDVSIYALNLTTALGLGLAIDYSLFVVSRFREELRAGHEPRRPSCRTVRTAGRTVAFSALTVAASLLATAGVPHHVPAQLRLRRRGGGPARRPVLAAGPAGHPGGARATGSTR